MKISRHASLGLAVLVLASSMASAANPPIWSGFDSGSDGWTILDLNCSNYGLSVGGGTITWFEGGGAPAGFIRSTDPSSSCYSYESPAAVEGNRSAYVGGSLSWQVRTNVADWIPGSVLILIGGGLVLVADVPQPPIGGWTSYVVPLEAAGFHLNTASGPAASPAQFAAVMGNLASIRISAEFGSEAGEETVDLDSVVLATACRADLDGDGLVGAADLALLLGAWGTADLAADLDSDWDVSASDLAILLGAWGPCG